MSNLIVTQRLPHKIIDLLLWLHETRPEIAEEERIADAQLPKSDALQALNGAWQRGALTQDEYQTIYARLNRRHGKDCSACTEGRAIFTLDDGRHLCGACAEEVSG
jgi:hypothetical protein